MCSTRQREVDLLRELVTIRCQDRHCLRERLSRGQAFPLAVDGGNRRCSAGRWVLITVSGPFAR